MEKILLLFGFSDIPALLAAGRLADSFGARAVPVSGADWAKPLGVLAGLDAPGAQRAAAARPGGQMLVLCGFSDGELDRLLPALRSAGFRCPKAVLTPFNRAWTPERLYGELLREQEALRAGRS